MNSTTRKILLYWTPLVIWMGLIFYGSSLRPTDVEMAYLNVGLSRPWQLTVAHFAEFAVLAAFFYRLIVVLDRWHQKGTALAVLSGCISYAVFDEAHQALVPGRVPALFDVLSDVLGASVGLVLTDTAARWLSGRGWGHFLPVVRRTP